ncbi:hypothetical protein Bca52824_007590 [Brassica carinata]|uniref:Uncharacterized protein n=1 Tax=Brassica carinata TaxID=52824 RepID=A0A8X8B806_BRACI|nr:hypothetical protein Bca52824_007590 [Brassica carinata]
MKSFDNGNHGQRRRRQEVTRNAKKKLHMRARYRSNLRVKDKERVDPNPDRSNHKNETRKGSNQNGSKWNNKDNKRLESRRRTPRRRSKESGRRSKWTSHNDDREDPSPPDAVKGETHQNQTESRSGKEISKNYCPQSTENTAMIEIGKAINITERKISAPVLRKPPKLLSGEIKKKANSREKEEKIKRERKNQI